MYIIQLIRMTDNTMNTTAWNPKNIKYMPMQTSDRGNKSVMLQNTDTKRAVRLCLPPFMTWGISDYLDKTTGESDGKFNISLNFPRDEDENKTAESDMALAKLQEFENKIIDDAVENSEDWFGEKLPREVIKHNYFTKIKYPKNKDTNKMDLTKPPTFQVKVPCYKNKDGTMDWKVELYSSVTEECIFPDTANPNIGPQDLVTKYARVICYIQCNGLWFGGKGWGVTWKMTAAIVNPVKIETASKPTLGLSARDRELLGGSSEPVTEPLSQHTTEKEEDVSTEVVDSDDEKEQPRPPTPPPVEAPKKKKVIKKVSKP